MGGSCCKRSAWLARFTPGRGSLALARAEGETINAEILAFHFGQITGRPFKALAPGNIQTPALATLRRETAIENHRAWLSAEILHPEAVPPENYRIVGRVLVARIGPECVALYHPESKTG